MLQTGWRRAFTQVPMCKQHTVYIPRPPPLALRAPTLDNNYLRHRLRLSMRPWLTDGRTLTETDGLHQDLAHLVSFGQQQFVMSFTRITQKSLRFPHIRGRANLKLFRPGQNFDGNSWLSFAVFTCGNLVYWMFVCGYFGTSWESCRCQSQPAWSQLFAGCCTMILCYQFV